MESSATDGVEALRRFTRFYTDRVGVLQQRLPGDAWSPTEARLLSEVATRTAPTAAELAKALGLDPGYLSRTLAGLEKRRLITRARSGEDARRQVLALTATGRDEFAALEAEWGKAMGALLAPLDGAARCRLTASLAEIEALLDDGGAAPSAYVLRPHRPGDMGWIIRRHAELYHEEFGWDASFEGFLADIAAAFLKSFDRAHDCCWMAESDGAIVGSVCLIRVSDEIAKLRLLLVEPRVRGRGIGKRLIEECIVFARRAGYAKITLWSNDILHAARRLYERAGFRLIAEEPYRRFGQDLVGQTWELIL